MYYKFNYMNYHIKLFFHLIQNLNIFQNNYYQLNFDQNKYILFNIIYYLYHICILKLYNYFKHQFNLFVQNFY